MIVKVPVSVGELFDKISILEIKLKYANKSQIINIKKELKLLNKKASKLNIDSNHIVKLREVNYNIWQIEDCIRKLESEKNFGDEFIETARMVYIFNDLRANIKRAINVEVKSGIIEEKVY